MARKPRQESGTGVYHVMMRGINRQNIFEEESDCARFLETPAECSTKEPSPCVCSFSVYNLFGTYQTSGYAYKPMGLYIAQAKYAK
jgi:hypothetical protein